MARFITIPLMVYNYIQEELNSCEALRCKMFNQEFNCHFDSYLYKNFGVIGFSYNFFLTHEKIHSLTLYVSTDYFLIDNSNIDLVSIWMDSIEVLERGDMVLKDTCYLYSQESYSSLINSFVHFGLIDDVKSFMNYSLNIRLMHYGHRYGDYLIFKRINIDEFKDDAVYIYNDLPREFYSTHRVRYNKFIVILDDDLEFIESILSLRLYEMCKEYICIYSVDDFDLLDGALDYINILKDSIILSDNLSIELEFNFNLNLKNSYLKYLESNLVDYDFNYTLLDSDSNQIRVKLYNLN